MEDHRVPRQSGDRICQQAPGLREVGLRGAPATIKRNKTRTKRLLLSHDGPERVAQPFVLKPRRAMQVALQRVEPVGRETGGTTGSGGGQTLPDQVSDRHRYGLLRQSAERR